MYIILINHRRDVYNRYWIKCDTKEEAESCKKNYEANDDDYKCMIIKAELV